MLGAFLRHATAGARAKISEHIARTCPYPTAVTLSGIVFAAAFALLHSSGALPAALATLILAFAVDTVDGSVARRVGKASKWGNYIDAMADKYVDALVFIGMGITNPLPALLAATGSLVLSYAKPRTAMVVQIDNHDWPAVGERVERGLLLIIGYAYYALVDNSPAVLDAVLYIVAAITWIGSVQRVLYAKKIISRNE